MPLTESSCARTDDTAATLKDVKTYLDPGTADHIQAVTLDDDSGNQLGIATNPVYVQGTVLTAIDTNAGTTIDAAITTDAQVIPLKNRAIRKSLHDFVTTLFETPPADTGWTAWNVYSESELRQRNFSPISPYVYIVDSPIEPTQTELPLIMIEVSHTTQPHQLGDTRGRLNLAFLHVFGKTRGERDDIASMLQDALSSFPIYNYYYQQGTTAISERAKVVGNVEVMTQSVGEIETHESSLLNWNIVRFKFETMDVN